MTVLLLWVNLFSVFCHSDNYLCYFCGFYVQMFFFQCVEIKGVGYPHENMVCFKGYHSSIQGMGNIETSWGTTWSPEQTVTEMLIEFWGFISQSDWNIGFMAAPNAPQWNHLFKQAKRRKMHISHLFAATISNTRIPLKQTLKIVMYDQIFTEA